MVEFDNRPPCVREVDLYKGFLLAGKEEIRMRICVFGAASDVVDKHFLAAGTELGKEIALRGHEVVFGGGAHGLMGTVAKGARDNGGKVTGVLPIFFKEQGIEALFEDCTEWIYTEDMKSRKATMEEESECFIVAPGGIGTFEEFFEVLVLKQLEQHRKPIAIYNVSGYFDDMLKMLEKSKDAKFIRGNCLGLYKVFNEGEFDAMFEYLKTEEPDDGIPVSGYKYG